MENKEKIEMTQDELVEFVNSKKDNDEFIMNIEFSEKSETDE